MGKTTLACATAVALVGRGRRVLIVSTDPASNLDEVLGTALDEQPRPVAGVAGLDAANIDPEAAAREYRERTVGPYRGLLPDTAVASMEESLSGACTVEIAAFDVFAGLLGDPEATAGYDHVIFDTAPTGHTLRLLALPAAWTGFIDTNTSGTSCLGPLAGLQDQRDLYAASVRALGDPRVTTLVLVSRPEQTALAEAERTRGELADAGMRHQVLALNGVFDAADSDDDPPSRSPRARATRSPRCPAGSPACHASRCRCWTSRRSGPTRSPASLTPRRPAPPASEAAGTQLPGAPLAELIDELESAGPRRDHDDGQGRRRQDHAGRRDRQRARAARASRSPVHDRSRRARRRRGRRRRCRACRSRASIPPSRRASTPSRSWRPPAPTSTTQARALLEEDLRSPCTEEIAVFRAFADTVACGEDGFVVLDTAPTGHSLLLLDAAQSYHRDVARGLSEVPDAVAQLLPRLRDPEYTRVLIVTLPEATPVHEAARLDDDLQRAGINPYAWIVNQSLAATGATHPTLAARARDEHAYIAEASELTERLALVAWQAQTPAGNRGLRALVAA